MNQTGTAAAFAHRDAPRIFCIGRNYAEHITELGNRFTGNKAIVFMKPLKSLVAPGEPIMLPSDRGAVHYEAEMVVEIGQGGADIDSVDARSHIRGIGLGLDLTLRDRQATLKDGGDPWERAKAFEASAPLGPITPLTDDLALDNMTFELLIDGELRQRGRADHMMVSVDELIAQLSRDWELGPGDLIYTGTPAGVGALSSGMNLELRGPGLTTSVWHVA